MTIDYKELLSVVVQICESRGAKATFTNSLKGGLLAGGGAFAGGLISGPIGIFIGAALGGLIGTKSSDFKPLHEVIQNELSDEERSELLTRVAAAIAKIGPEDAIALSIFLLGPKQELVLTAVKLFFDEVRHTQITYN